MGDPLDLPAAADQAAGRVRRAMTDQDIMRLCQAVSSFSSETDWRWHAPPAIEWQFSTHAEFDKAKGDLLKAVVRSSRGDPATHTVNMNEEWVEWREKVMSPTVCAIECHGVMLRLVCTERPEIVKPVKGVNLGRQQIGKPGPRDDGSRP